MDHHKIVDDIKEVEESKKKSILTERRRTQMKWCEEQRYKLQAEIKKLEVAKSAISNLLQHHLKEHSSLVEIQRNLVDQLKPGSCRGDVPQDISFHFQASSHSNEDGSDSDTSESEFTLKP